MSFEIGQLVRVDLESGHVVGKVESGEADNLDGSIGVVTKVNDDGSVMVAVKGMKPMSKISVSIGVAEKAKPEDVARLGDELRRLEAKG